MPWIVPILSLLLLVLAPSVAGARGFHAGFGLFPRDRLAHGPRAAQPGAYVVIDFAAIGNEKALQDATAKLDGDVAPFKGRMIVDDAAPAALGGTASGAVVLLAFADRENAQDWAKSPGFKDFEAAARKAATARIFIVDSLPGAMTPDAGADRRAEHERAFEKMVKDRDKILNQTKDICTGC